MNYRHPTTEESLYRASNIIRHCARLTATLATSLLDQLSELVKHMETTQCIGVALQQDVKVVLISFKSIKRFANLQK